MKAAISSLIASAEAGDPAAAEALFTALYDELHRLARRQLLRSGADLTLGTTSLLHEAYLDLAGRSATRFPDRARFMAYSARAMRALVIDHARRRRARKRGGGGAHVELTDDVAAPDLAHRDLASLGAAVDRLAGVEPALAEVVDLKFFCGFSFVEIAAMRGVSERTVQRQWEKARIFLHEALEDG